MTYKKKRPSSKLGRSLFVGIALEHYFHGETAIEKVIVHATPVWWSRGKSISIIIPDGMIIVVLPPSSRRQATVHRTVAFRLVRFLYNPINETSHPIGWLVSLVEPRGIEPLSESNLEGTSPGAVCYLHSLKRAGTNTLSFLVAS